jgi:hypothetical protein
MNYKDYFEKRDAGLPKPKWVYGDRVFSKYKSVPLVGMVIRQTSSDDVLIHSDLPVKIGKGIHNIISVPQRDVKRLKEM